VETRQTIRENCQKDGKRKKSKEKRIRQNPLVHLESGSLEHILSNLEKILYESLIILSFLVIEDFIKKRNEV